MGDCCADVGRPCDSYASLLYPNALRPVWPLLYGLFAMLSPTVVYAPRLCNPVFAEL
jgi:hypothetical protein